MGWLSPSVKAALSYPLSRSRVPVLVNSFGRSGSTALFDAVSASASRASGLGGRAIRAVAWRLDSEPLEGGLIYKSHDYPSAHIRPSVRVIYTFGDPLDAVASVIHQAGTTGWLARHCYHLRAPVCTVDDLVGGDVLNMAGHLDAWLRWTLHDVAFVRYEAMWDHEADLSEFLGFPVALPPRTPRFRTTSP